MMKLQVDNSSKNFYKTAILMMIPLTIQGLMDNFISLINTFLVGQFPSGSFSSDSIVAGIGSQTNIFEIVWYGLIGLVISGNVYTAQYYGAKDYPKVRETMNAKLCYMICFALICFVIVESMTPNLIGAILGSDQGDHLNQDAVTIGVRYTRLVALSYPLLAASYCFAMTMNALGKIKITLWASLVGLLTNITISCCFGFIGDHDVIFKIDGLAIGVILSWGFSTLVYVIYFIVKRPVVRPMANILFITKDMHKKMINTSIPNVLNQLVLGFALVIQISIFARNGGAQAVAALQIVLTIFTLLYSIFRPLTGLTAFFVGKELGANNLDLAKVNAARVMKLVFCVSFILALVFLSMAWWVPQYLYPELSEYTQNLASWYLYFAPISFLCTALMQLIMLILGIGGFQTIASIANIAMQWLLDVLVVYLLFNLTNISIHYILMIGCLLKIAEFGIMFLLYYIIPWNRNLIRVEEARVTGKHLVSGKKKYAVRQVNKKQIHQHHSDKK